MCAAHDEGVFMRTASLLCCSAQIPSLAARRSVATLAARLGIAVPDGTVEFTEKQWVLPKDIVDRMVRPAAPLVASDVDNEQADFEGRETPSDQTHTQTPAQVLQALRVLASTQLLGMELSSLLPLLSPKCILELLAAKQAMHPGPASPPQAALDWEHWSCCTAEPDEVFFESQEPGFARCGLHALNNVVGHRMFEPTDLSRACDVFLEEAALPSHQGMCAFAESRSDHESASGWYSSEVLACALRRTMQFEMSLRPLSSESCHILLEPSCAGALSHQQETDGSGRHWVALRRGAHGIWCLDSLKQPVLLTEEALKDHIARHPRIYPVRVLGTQPPPAADEVSLVGDEIMESSVHAASSFGAAEASAASAGPPQLRACTTLMQLSYYRDKLNAIRMAEDNQAQHATHERAAAAEAEARRLDEAHSKAVLVAGEARRQYRIHRTALTSLEIRCEETPRDQDLRTHTSKKKLDVAAALRSKIEYEDQEREGILAKRAGAQARRNAAQAERRAAADLKHRREVEDQSLLRQESSLKKLSCVVRPLFSGPLRFMSSPQRRSKQCVMTAVAIDGVALEHASTPLKNDKDVALAAVGSASMALQWVSEGLRGDNDVCKASLTRRAEEVPLRARGRGRGPPKNGGGVGEIEQRAGVGRSSAVDASSAAEAPKRAGACVVSNIGKADSHKRSRPRHAATPEAVAQHSSQAQEIGRGVPTVLTQTGQPKSSQINLYAVGKQWCSRLPTQHHAELKALWKSAADDETFLQMLRELVSLYPTQEHSSSGLSAKRAQGWREALATHLGVNAPSWL